MAWDSSWSRFPRQATVWERQRDAERAVAKLEKKGRALQPVRLEGRRAMAATFWGKAWCEHIETYSDYSNRLPRGRSYARNGSVIDLRLEPGVVHALVSGSRVYTVKIEVTPLAKARWKELVAQCAGQIDSLIALLQGQLPDAVLARLADPVSGLFPAANQLAMTCSCPDWAGLCKHLAAVLYGVGARLDDEPQLLFLLRRVDQLELVGEAAGGALLARASEEGSLAPEALGDIFGIELHAEQAAPPKKPRSRPRRAKAPAAPQALDLGRALADYRRTLEKLGGALRKVQAEGRGGRQRRKPAARPGRGSTGRRG